MIKRYDAEGVHGRPVPILVLFEPHALPPLLAKGSEIRGHKRITGMEQLLEIVRSSARGIDLLKGMHHGICRLAHSADLYTRQLIKV